MHSTLDAKRHWIAQSGSERRDSAESSPPRIDISKLVDPLELGTSVHSIACVSPGHRRELSCATSVMMHFVKSGSGWLASENRPPVPIFQGSLVVVPSNGQTTLCAASSRASGHELAARPSEGTRPAVARVGEAAYEGLVLFSAAISARYAIEVGLFDSLKGPLIERFEVGSPSELVLADIERELAARDCGMNAMVEAMLRQVLVQILRRSIANGHLWSERFSAFGDERISQAFIDMANSPGANHSTVRMASRAGLSRSFFMRRFHEAFGVTPGVVLRQLRMRRALMLLKGEQLSVGRISEEVGYASRSSFLRAFRQTYGCEPSEYDESRQQASGVPRVQTPAAPRANARARSEVPSPFLECSV